MNGVWRKQKDQHYFLRVLTRDDHQVRPVLGTDEDYLLREYQDESELVLGDELLVQRGEIITRYEVLPPLHPELRLVRASGGKGGI